MSSHQDHLELKELLESAGPYPLDAFDFVREGLSHTTDSVHGDGAQGDGEVSRHVSGQELCLGLRDYAIERYGLLAPVVLRSWHIHRTDDFGRIVFAMIDGGLMSKTADDTMDDFRAVYEFREVFTRDAIIDHLRWRR